MPVLSDPPKQRRLAEPVRRGICDRVRQVIGALFNLLTCKPQFSLCCGQAFWDDWVEKGG